jgi:hypothetical protein
MIQPVGQVSLRLVRMIKATEREKSVRILEIYLQYRHLEQNAERSPYFRARGLLARALSIICQITRKIILACNAFS